MDFEIVHLASPYNTLKQEEGKKYFSECLAARIDSYQERYGDNVFPLGPEDFVSDHIMINRRMKDGTNMILGTFKIVDYQTCHDFSLTFPLIHTLSNPVNPKDCLNMVNDYIGESDQHQRKISYIGGMTVHPSVKYDALLRREIRSLIAACQVFSVNERGVELLVTGTVPNGSSRYLEWMGLTKFYKEKVTVWDVGRTSAYVMHLKRWSDSVSELALQYQELWERRVFIGDNTALEQKKMAG